MAFAYIQTTLNMAVGLLRFAYEIFTNVRVPITHQKCETKIILKTFLTIMNYIDKTALPP